MWLLPTRGRVELCQTTIDACETTGMQSRCLIMADPRGGGDYRTLRLPANFDLQIAPLDMADCMRFTFTHWPRERVYGWLADDLVPITPGWCAELEREAHPFYFADCRDDYLAFDDERGALSPHFSGAFCWGGDMVRAVGWWALPSVRQAGIDDAWSEIVCSGTYGLRHHRRDILVRHDNFRTGRRLKDETDDWTRDGEHYIQVDFKVFSDWHNARGAAIAREKIFKAMSGGAA